MAEGRTEPSYDDISVQSSKTNLARNYGWLKGAWAKVGVPVKREIFKQRGKRILQVWKYGSHTIKAQESQFLLTVQIACSLILASQEVMMETDWVNDFLGPTDVTQVGENTF